MKMDLQPITPTLPGRVPSAFERAMEGLPTLWGRLAQGIDYGEDRLRQAIAEADALPADMRDQILAAAKGAPRDEQSRFVRMLVSAWPNASQNDLAGFGAQLARDVEQENPTSYALEQAARKLRRTSRFLPSISEVLDAIEEADKRVAAVAKSFDRIPAALAQAKALIADRDREFGS